MDLNSSRSRKQNLWFQIRWHYLVQIWCTIWTSSWTQNSCLKSRLQLWEGVGPSHNCILCISCTHSWTEGASSWLLLPQTTLNWTITVHSAWTDPEYHLELSVGAECSSLNNYACSLLCPWGIPTPHAALAPNRLPGTIQDVTYHFYRSIWHRTGLSVRTSVYSTHCQKNTAIL